MATNHFGREVFSDGRIARCLLKDFRVSGHCQGGTILSCISRMVNDRGEGRERKGVVRSREQKKEYARQRQRPPNIRVQMADGATTVSKCRRDISQCAEKIECLFLVVQGMAISEGVADSVVSALGKRKCGTLQEGYAACVQIIRSLMKCSDGPEWLLQSGAMGALVGCLTDPKVGSSAQSETILVLLTLSAGQNEKAMLDAGVVEALVSYLKEAPADAGPMQDQYVVFAMKVLMNLSVPEVQERFVAAGGIETLVAKLGSGTGEQRLQVLKNLMNLGASMEMKVPMVNKGITQALSKLVENSQAGSEEILLSLKVLMNIASHKETKVTMVENGVVDMMLRLCSKEGVERDYQLQCLKVMMSLATHQDTKVCMPSLIHPARILPLATQGAALLSFSRLSKVTLKAM